jgi:hypothetical protein
MAQFTETELEEINEEIATIYRIITQSLMQGDLNRLQPDFEHGQETQASPTTRDVVQDLYNKVRGLAVRYSVSEH